MTTQEKCFAVTAAFEGGGYGALSGNFDGQGVSFGFLQWNFGQGTLQALLKAMQKNGPETFKRCCSVPVLSRGVTDLSADLMAVCDMPPAQAVRWWADRQDGGHRLLPHWVQVFRNLAAEPGYQAMQRKAAEEPYWRLAVQYVREFGFTSERGLALCFDICVQMGSVTAKSQRRYTAAVSSGASEVARLEALARAVGPQAGQWERDVLSRKLTIALGSGVVHGRAYHLERDFGLTMDPIT
jgi:hypothetical protein